MKYFGKYLPQSQCQLKSRGGDNGHEWGRMPKERKKERQGNSLLEAPDEEVGADHDVVDLGLGVHNPDDEELSGMTSSRR